MKPTNYIRIDNGRIDAKIDVFMYVKDGLHFAYAPALDIIGYGKTQEDAQASFEVVIEDYFEYGIKRGTLAKDLEKHGWKREKEEFEVPNIWLVIANNKSARQLSSNDFHKVSVPFNHEVACH